MFKKLILLSIVLTTISSCTEKNPSAFSFSGTLTPASADYIILKKETDIERKIAELIDTITVDAQGKFNYSFTDEPYLYSLNFPNKKKIDIALNTGQVLQLTINDYDTDAMNGSAQGSKDTEALLAYEHFRAESLDRLVKSVRREIKALKKEATPDLEKIAKLGQQEVDNYETHLTELNEFITTKMENSIGLYATSIRWKGAQNLPLFESLTSGFENAHPSLNIRKKIREKVARLQQTAIGGSVKEITMMSPEGKTISLSSVAKKYTLIDFWASWCGPCRRESESLNLLYKKYRSDGFEIYGVSLDDDREKWLAALEKDQRIWTNVSTLERFKTPAAFDYAVTALPDNYLIDTNNEIIAKNIHGHELEILLSKLLDK